MNTEPISINHEIAKIVQQQWATLGVHIEIQLPETRQEFEELLLERNYDILLFGQSLLDNLDSYPYWHSSNIQRLSGEKKDLRLDAYNLSQYSSLETDSLLERIRQTYDPEERTQSLEELREILKRDVPAIFLYAPLYTFAFEQDLQGIDLGDLSMHSDRFLTLHKWFTKEERRFVPGKSWWSFLPWLFSSRSAT
jgi:peptide/nickel transport system substrate-binding protein